MAAAAREAFPAVAITSWLAQGKLPERGFMTPEELVVGARFEPFMAALKDNGVVVSYKGPVPA